MGQLYLGVDGGGTKCRMRLVDQNQKILGEAIVHAPANLQIRNGDAAYVAIRELTGLVFADAGLDVNEAANTHACFGMAGARMQSARESFSQRDFPFASVLVVDDIDVARAGAHEGEDGAVLIIGTGSAGLGQVAGKRLQIGGWGFLVGDTMAGATLGRRLLRKSLLAFEGIEKSSPLTKAVMAEFDDQPEMLMSWSFNNPDAAEVVEKLQAEGAYPSSIGAINARPSDYGKFVPMIFDYLEKDDVVAKELLEFELEAIDQYIRWFTSRGIGAIAVVGGLGQRIYPMLEEKYPGVMVQPKSDPMQGAIILATQAAGKTS